MVLLSVLDLSSLKLFVKSTASISFKVRFDVFGRWPEYSSRTVLSIFPTYVFKKPEMPDFDEGTEEGRYRR